MASLSFLDFQHELDFQTSIRDGSGTGSDFLVARCGKKNGDPHSPLYKIILKNSLSLTNLTLISLKYKREMSLDHLKQFLLTVLEVKEASRQAAGQTVEELSIGLPLYQTCSLYM
jgi:hypothetical protein